MRSYKIVRLVCTRTKKKKKIEPFFIYEKLYQVICIVLNKTRL